MEEKRNNIIITPQIDLWSKENYPEEFLKLNNYIKSLPNITDKRFKRSTEINIRRIKGNFFDAYNLIVSHNLDKELLFDEIEQNANAETVHDLTGNSSCFGFTPALYSPLGYKELPLVMSARHIYLCTNPFGFYSDNLAHYHNLDISVLEDIPNNLNNVIFMYQGKRQTESIVSVLDYDIPIKDEFGNVTTNKTKLQLIIKPKPIGIKTFFSNLPIESNLLATAFEFNSINNERILYVNKNKKSLAQQLISHSIPNGRDRTEVVSNTGFYKKNIKHYIESVNKNLKLKEPFLYNEIFIDRINLEIEKSENPDVEDIIKNIKKDFLSTSPIPKNIQSISDSVLSFENNKSDILDIIGKQFETDSSGKPTLNGMKQLSKAMEIYSDKHYETARYIFIKDGVITRHIAVSSQTPSSTIIKPDEGFLYQLKNYAEETGSKIVFLHNHPSGYVKPSEADVNLTEYLTNFFEEQNGEKFFSGHIILDHGTYGLYESENRSWNALINDEIKPLSEVEKNYKIELTEHKKKADFNRDYTITERSLKELSEYAKACDNGEVWNKKDWIPAFLLTGNGIVTSLEYINTLELQNEDSLSEKLKFLGRKYGSESIIMLPSDKQQFLMCERYAQDTGKVKDVFLQNSDGTFEVSDYRNGNIFNDLRVDEIKLEDTMTKNDAVLQKIEKEQKLRNENDSIYNESVNKNINNHKENKTMNKKTIKAFDIYSELKELIGDNNYEALKFATMDYLYNRGIDDAAGYEDSVERNKARFMELPTNIQNVMEKYDDYKIDFDDKALAIKIAGTRNGNLDKAKAQKDEEIANRNYIRESLNLSVLNERPMDISVEPEQAEIVENPMEISEDTTEPDPNDSVTSDENGTQLNKILKKLEEKEKIIEKLQKQNQIIMEQNQVNSQKLAALEQQIKAPKEAQEKSANDSMGQDYNNSSSVEHQNLTNQDGFGRDTAYKKNQKVPTFGILQDDGHHQLIKNAVFSKLLVDEENPANNKIELLVLKENGKQETFQIEEKLYNDIINNVQEFEQRKQGQSKDSWDWMRAHMDYAEKMGTDDNSFRLNTAENFIHNFRVHCMRDEAHNPEQALKVAGIMFDRMAKREKERFLKTRKQWDKRAKINGGPTFDEHLIKQFNEFHPKKDINIEQIKGYYFDANEAVDKQNLMYESLRSGKIEGTNTNIGDTISFAMKYKDTFSGKHLKTPKEDWKIVEVSKCLSGDRALIYNEKSKAYYKIPLENLVEQIRKNERLQTKEEKKAIMQDHKNFGYDGPER